MGTVSFQEKRSVMILEILLAQLLVRRKGTIKEEREIQNCKREWLELSTSFKYLSYFYLESTL